MRASEWINVFTLTGFTAIAWFLPKLSPQRRKTITLISAFSIAVVLVGRFTNPVARDWLPYALILPVYWAAGQFVTRVDFGFQRRLEALDRAAAIPLIDWCARHPIGRRLLALLELAYMLCYVSVPLGLVAVYLLGLRSRAEYFWVAVLGATYPCYVALVFVQTMPPRMQAEKPDHRRPSGPLRRLNLWLLKKASIHANTFPSAHVASSMACGMVLLHLAPSIGVGFLVTAIAIALGAVAGRYHYTADIIAGTLAAFAASAVAGVVAR